MDYHPDHEATSILVRDAVFASSVPNYKTGPSRALDSIPHLYFMDPIEGRDRAGNRIAPDFAVDVTHFFDKKRDMLAGALDASFSPLQMKKNRPGALLRVISKPEHQEQLLRAL